MNFSRCVYIEFLNMLSPLLQVTSCTTSIIPWWRRWRWTHVTGSRGKQRRLPPVLHQLICWPTVYPTSMPVFSLSQRPFLRDTKGLSVYFSAQNMFNRTRNELRWPRILLSLKLHPTPAFLSIDTASCTFPCIEVNKYRRSQLFSVVVTWKCL